MLWRKEESVILLGIRPQFFGFLAHNLVNISPQIQCEWGRDIPHPYRQSLGPTQLSIQWVSSVSQWKCGRGMALATQPQLAMSLRRV